MMRVAYLGKTSYQDALRLQKAIFDAKIKRQKAIQRAAAGLDTSSSGAALQPLPDTILVLEHDPAVYTMGRRDTSSGFKKDGAQPEKKSTVSGKKVELPTFHEGIKVEKISRGGGITWHGPGQVTMYPICNVKTLWKNCATMSTKEKGSSPVRWYSDMLEKTMIDTAKKFGVTNCEPGSVGVWVPPAAAKSSEVASIASSGETCSLKEKGVCSAASPGARKLGSIGLQLSDWVSMHGISFNVHNDLECFRQIVMCELPDRDATNLHETVAELNNTAVQSTDGAPHPSLPQPTMPHVATQLVESFLDALGQGDTFKKESVVLLENKKKKMELETSPFVFENATCATAEEAWEVTPNSGASLLDALLKELEQ